MKKYPAHTFVNVEDDKDLQSRNYGSCIIVEDPGYHPDKCRLFKLLSYRRLRTAIICIKGAHHLLYNLAPHKHKARMLYYRLNKKHLLHGFRKRYRTKIKK